MSRATSGASHAAGVLRSWWSGSATVCTTVIDAKLGKMWIARKPYERIDFAEYAIAADTAAKPVTQLAA